jgi:hypothetical protein
VPLGTFAHTGPPDAACQWTAISLGRVERSVLQLSSLIAAAGLAASGLSACGGGNGHTFSDRSIGLSFRYPSAWSSSGFSRRVSPPRLVVGSYPIRPSDALGRLPRDGAAVLLIDYGPSHRFPRHPSAFNLSQFHPGDYECFGQSWMLRFRRGGHDIQAHVALGVAADPMKRKQALTVLDSLR